MPFDTAAIFRTAHAAGRRRMAPSQTRRYGDRWNAEANGYVPTIGYREAFRAALMFAWHDAKSIAMSAQIDAETLPLPEDVEERVRFMRADADFEPINTVGNARRRQILAEAAFIEDAARNAQGGLPC